LIKLSKENFMTKQKTIMLMVDENFKYQVNEQAHNERVTMSELIRRVMADYIEDKNNGGSK
jgi:hypothetical protein